MARIPLFMSLFLHASLTLATPLPESARAEITAVIQALADSDCEFYRNGTWYAGSRAASHLQRKLDYMEKKGLVSSADAFITLGASKSSMSDEAYQVRCPGEATVPSAIWLRGKLDRIRAGAL